MSVVPMTTAKPGDEITVEPSERVRLLIEQRDALNERIEAERQRDIGRAELVLWLKQHPQLDRHDLKTVGEMAFGRFKAAKAARTGMRHGFTEPKGIKGKVGRAIVEGRRAKNLSRSQLASLLHTSNGSVHQWESGKHAPTPAMRAKLAKALGMPPNRFTEGD